jgi:predicted nuclease of predicted toxin-antitoxin system
VDDVGLSGRSGEEVLAFAWEEQRILLTHDFDFLDDSRFPFQRNPGLVVLPGGTDSRVGLADAINGG